MKPTLPILTAAAVAALSLAACDDRQARVAAPEAASLSEMDALANLPPAEPARVRYSEPDEGYGYAERAYGLQRTFYDEPPEYGFEYGGYEPMVWRTADDREMYAEPWDDGYRYYYYEPGAAYPYFVQDDDYGYGFDSAGVLIAVVTATGAYLQRDDYYRLAPVAGRYYVRGRQLRDVGLRAPRVRVTETVWRAKAPRIQQSAQPWIRAAEAEPEWRTWREKRGPKRDLAFQAQGRERDRFDGIERGREAAPVPPARAVRERPEHRNDRQDGGGGQKRREVAAAPQPRPDAPKHAIERRDDKSHGRPHEVRQAQAAPRPQPAARNAEQQARPAAAVGGGGRQDHGGPKSHERQAERAAAAPKPDKGGGHERGGGQAKDHGPDKGKGGGKKD